MKPSTIVTLLATASATLGSGCTLDVCAEGGGCTSESIDDGQVKALPPGDPPYRKNLRLFRLTSGKGVLTSDGKIITGTMTAPFTVDAPDVLTSATAFFCGIPNH